MMKWSLHIENRQLRKFCEHDCQPVNGVAAMLLGAALDAGADALEIAADGIRLRIGGNWRDTARIPAHVVPAVCALLLLVGSSGRHNGVLTLTRGVEKRQIQIDYKALKLSLVIQ